MERIQNKKIFLVLLVTFLVVAGSSSSALAHRATIFAWVEGDTVFTESKFSGGKRAVNSPVRVYDEKGREILNGKTDDRGEFSFKIPEMTALKIVLEAGMGHRAEWHITEAELRGDLDVTPGSAKPVESFPERTTLLSSEEVKQIVEDSLDTKLRPIARRLAEMEEKGPSVTEVLGGIGYIFGLMGVALYFKSRGRNDG
jgi:nickel transport protein